jgi:hypothetical protein
MHVTCHFDSKLLQECIRIHTLSMRGQGLSILSISYISCTENLEASRTNARSRIVDTFNKLQFMHKES